MKYSVARVTVSSALLLAYGAAHAQIQETNPEPLPNMQAEGHEAEGHSGVNGPRLAIVGGALFAGMVGIHIYQQNGWWKDNQRSFHFREDLDYGLGVDKLGHFYGASVITFVFSRALQWANLPEGESLLWGAGASLLFQTYVETRDGFSEWGFDRVDFAANVAGSLHPLAQYHVPLLRNFNLKFSYHPSDLLNNQGGIGFRGQQHIMFDDYEGQTFWLSFTVDKLLPRSVEPLWPDWLALSLGYGARDIAGNEAHSILLIGLDYDMTEIIPQSSGFLRTLSQALNYIRFPAPAVRISPGAIWYGFYF